MSMILETLPNLSEHESIFWRFKKDNEYLGIAKIKKDLIDFDTVDRTRRNIESFFLKGIHTDVEWTNVYDSKSLSYRDFQENVEYYTKLSWLSGDYIKENGFKNPIGLHWNPRTKLFNIHPGGTRQKIYYYFGPAEIEGLVFNTNGYDINFTKKFNNIDQLRTEYNTDVTLVLVADHGSLIPHVHFSQQSLLESVKKNFYKIKEFYETTRIVTNFKFKKYGYNEDIILKDVQKEIHVTVTQKDEISCIRAIALMPFFDSFEDYGVKIECT